MKRSTLAFLCCPDCKGELVLTVTDGDEQVVRKGKLHCPVCLIDYPIEDGIPDLLSRTRSGWGSPPGSRK